MIIEFSEADESRVRWNSGGEWKSADIDELIAAYERKRGKWETEVRTIRGHKIQFFACSVCGRNADGEYPYCPNCGAKMEMSEDDPKG